MEAERETEPEGGLKKAVLVRYGRLPRVEYFSTQIADVRRGAMCVAETERGTEFVRILSDPEPAAGRELRGRILMPASGRDLGRMRYIDTELAPRELTTCKKKASEAGLTMRLVAVEHLFGGEKIIFYFTAEERVDFRALVRDLAREFRTRIELRQIGVRDEARMLADFEHCGRPLCCKTFLAHFEPVTMRMAKLQKSTLDPGKISGRCGRLMCCLRFEEEIYEELRGALPRKGTPVRIGETSGKVVGVEVLAQKVTVRTDEGAELSVHVTEIQTEKKQPEPRRRPEREEPEEPEEPDEPQVGGPPLEPS